MQVELWVWAVTIAVLGVILLADFVVQLRRPHEPTFRESAIQVSIYISLALLFTFVIGGVWGPQYAAEYIAGWVTEYSLSVDNIFVFLIIFTQFAVPKRLRSQVLLIGIAIALVLRLIFIVLGAAFIERFSWAFYVFGAFLIFTAIKLVIETFHDGEEDRNEAGGMTKFISKIIPTTNEYHDDKYRIKRDGKWVYTPLLLVMISIGFTDLLFALDSIPATFGVTQEPFLVFAANAFALLGLRALYFLLKGLLDKLVYLSLGLSVILMFIGVKLILTYLHETWTEIPKIPTVGSLAVIGLILFVSTVASFIKVRKDPTAQAHAGRMTSGKHSEESH